MTTKVKTWNTTGTLHVPFAAGQNQFGETGTSYRIGGIICCEADSTEEVKSALVREASAKGHTLFVDVTGPYQPQRVTKARRLVA